MISDFGFRIFCICVLCAALSAPSCTWRLARAPGVLVESLLSDPPTLNPILATDFTERMVNQHVFESLLDMDNETLGLVPSLASRWEVSPDHLVYTFWLRDDVRWHDGVPFTADDVIYTFDRIRDPKVDAARLRNYFRDVKEIERVGPNAVKFVYAKPYFRALDIIGRATIIPKHVFDDGSDFNSHGANRRPIGTGPYRFVEWKTGRWVKLDRFEGYWGRRPRIDGIVFKIIPDQMVAFQLLKKGALDLAEVRTIQWVRQTESRAFEEKFAKHRYYLPNYSFIGWNMRRPFFSDRRVRKAMTMLVNRQAILEKVLFGQGEIVSGSFYRFGPYYDESIEPYPYDPEEAKRLLAGAGWADHDGDGVLDRDGMPFRFVLLSAAGDRLAMSLGLFLREELSRVGIVMEARQLEWATMLALLARRDFDAAALGRAMPLEDDPYQSWHSSQAADGSNFAGFADAGADEIIEEARREFDRDRRAVLYRKLQGIIHREEPCTFLFTTPSLVAVAGRFTDVRAYKVGIDTLEWGVGPWPVLVEW